MLFQRACDGVAVPDVAVQTCDAVAPNYDLGDFDAVSCICAVDVSNISTACDLDVYGDRDFDIILVRFALTLDLVCIGRAFLGLGMPTCFVNYKD